MQLAAARLPTLFTGTTITLQSQAFFSSLYFLRPPISPNLFASQNRDESCPRNTSTICFRTRGLCLWPLHYLFETTDRGCNSQLLASLLYLQARRELCKVKLLFSSLCLRRPPYNKVGHLSPHSICAPEELPPTYFKAQMPNLVKM